MENVINLRNSEKRKEKMQREIKNFNIIHSLFSQGLINVNPIVHKESEYNRFSKGHVIHIPEQCFKTHQFYKVGA